MITNGMNLLGVQIYWQMLIKGLILVLALIVDVLESRKKKSGIPPASWAKLRLQNSETSCIIADRKTCRQVSAGRVILCIR